MTFVSCEKRSFSQRWCWWDEWDCQRPWRQYLVTCVWQLGKLQSRLRNGHRLAKLDGRKLGSFLRDRRTTVCSPKRQVRESYGYKTTGPGFIRRTSRQRQWTVVLCGLQCKGQTQSHLFLTKVFSHPISWLSLRSWVAHPKYNHNPQIFQQSSLVRILNCIWNNADVTGDWLARDHKQHIQGDH